MASRALKRIAHDLRSVLAALEPERLSGPDATQLLVLFSEIEKLASGGRLLAARRVESSNAWRRTGHRSAAAAVAEATGTGLGSAITALDAARHLDTLPATDEAMRDGRLSEAQVKEITGAAILQPAAEQELVDAAEKQPMNVLKLRCRRVKAAGREGPATYRAIRRGRFLRHWTDGDGAVRLDAKLTPDDGARLVAAVKERSGELAVEASKAGHSESSQALAADALVSLASGERMGGSTGRNGSTRRGGSSGRNGRSRGSGNSEGGPSAMVHVRVDHSALTRGRVRNGEVCEIPGIGPIPVDVARRLAADSILSVLVTDGVDVTAVAHAGRTISAAVRRALVERDQTCVVPGCEVREPLEIDHVQPLALGGRTSLDNLVRLCRWHHYLKTHQRHRLEPGGKGWRWILPSEQLAVARRPRPG